jgi:4-hydroxy-3-polyprenylbenzoate decarboxylase
MTSPSMKVVVGVSGATGAPYAASILRFLAGPGREAGIETHVVFTKYGRVCWSDEVGTDPQEFGFPIWSPADMTAPFASGSSRFAGMIIAPCSGGQLGRIASGLSLDLVGRTADVMLKERRRLVILLRESPYSLVHIRQMAAVTEAGGVILPASPSFYPHPRDISELVDTVAARALDLLGVDNELMHRWNGFRSRKPEST